MKLYIAEKPSLGRAIAEVLPKPHKKQPGYIMAGDGSCVTWCVGHLLEQAPPDAYDPQYKQWRLDTLPIIPDKWQLQAKPATRDQLGVVKKLLKQASHIVHAGDPDREGQLLVDQVLQHLGVSGERWNRVQRCLINDMNPAAITRALQQLRSNREFASLSTSALARTRADWLYGINLSRAYTLQGKKVGYQGVLSIGRVQTPILGLVVRRDDTIENFVSKPFYDVIAHVETATGVCFPARWQPSDACRPYQDEDGRVLVKALAENVAGRITGQPAEVVSVEKKPRTQAPPLPYNLSSLQIDAARQFGLTAQQVLDGCQQLYERHKLITYPRSDCRYLPTDHYAERDAVLAALGSVATHLEPACRQAQTGLRSKAWDDARVDAHHAIIPTLRRVDPARLSSTELKLYGLIARQYLAQFYPAHRFQETRVTLQIAGGRFLAQARQVEALGWKVLFGRGDASSGSRTDDARTEARDQLVDIPPLNKGDVLQCLRGEVQEKHTQPPPYFTDASLLSAMTGIARFVTDPDIRKILRDTDGLGTEATRAGIIELLFERGFLTRQGKSIRATPVGRGLIQSLPDQMVTPDMTAQWETALNAISQRAQSYQAFMTPLQQQLHQLIALSQASLPMALQGLRGEKPRFRQRGKTRRGSAKRSRKPKDRANPS